MEESQCGYRWTTRKILVMNKMFCILITNANPLVAILCYHSMKLSLWETGWYTQGLPVYNLLQLQVKLPLSQNKAFNLNNQLKIN